MERLQAFSGIKCNMRSCCLVAGSHVFSSFLMFLAMVTSSCCLQKRNIAGNGESVQSDSSSLDIWQHCSRTDLDKLPGLFLIACVSGHGLSKLITFGHRQFLSRMCFWPFSHLAAIVLACFCYLFANVSGHSHIWTHHPEQGSVKWARDFSKLFYLCSHGGHGQDLQTSWTRPCAGEWPGPCRADATDATALDRC